MLEKQPYIEDDLGEKAKELADFVVKLDTAFYEAEKTGFIKGIFVAFACIFTVFALNNAFEKYQTHKARNQVAQAIKDLQNDPILMKLSIEKAKQYAEQHKTK